MSDRVRSAFTAVTALFLLLLSSCGGGGDVLATVGGIEITGDDFRETFDRLSPEEQVRVLDPGGRMALLERIVHRTILEQECSKNPPEGVVLWEDLYGTAWLSAEWMSSAAVAFDPSLDGADSLMFTSSFSLAVVLMEDSTHAEETASDWNISGPSQPDAGMALAPWSSGESSFTILTGLLAHLPQDLARLFQGFQGEGAVVRPAFGAWAVGELEISLLDSVPALDGREGSLLFSRYLADLTPIEIYSASVGSLASMVVIENGVYILSHVEGADADAILASWSGGDLTVGELAVIMENVRAENFFEGIPPELEAFAPPDPMLGPGVDMWFYVSRTARTMTQAGLASDEAVVVPGHVISTARAEHHLRVSVLEPLLSPDPEDITAFYQERIEVYSLPERRSVSLAYVDSTGVPFPSDVSSFDDLGVYRTMVDDAGDMMPTPLQPAEAFGELLGEAVFMAEPGVFTGPVIAPGGSMAAYFRVIEVAEPAPIPPEDIWLDLKNDYRRTRVPQDLDAYLMELWTLYSVEIDSSRVQGIDPWARTY